MKVYRPRHIRLEGEQKITETPSTPADKTDKTPPTPGFGGFVSAPSRGFEDFLGDATRPPTPEPQVLAVLSAPLQGVLQNFEGQPEPPANPEFSQNPQTPVDKTDKTPWAYLLSQVDALAARLVELQAPRLRIDLDGRAVGYYALEVQPLEGVASLLREMLEALAVTYPYPEGPVQIIALWPGTISRPVRREVLAEVQSEVQHG